MADQEQNKQSILKTMYTLYQTFRKGSGAARHRLDKLGGTAITSTTDLGKLGTADWFVKHGVTMGGRSMFPYRSGIASSFDRQGRITTFLEMDQDPYASAALDLIADFVCDPDENDNVLTINCEDQKIKSILESLYYDVLAMESNMWQFARNTAKFGEQFLLINWHPDFGVMGLLPLPTHEVEREEGFDENNPMAVRFKWNTRPHRKIQAWEMLHIRLLGMDHILPFGTSVLESARRAFQQYLMMFDAMMIYRMVRAPERLVFKIEVGSTPPEEVDQLIENQKQKLKMATVVDSSNGILDKRYDPMVMMEDYFLPKRGDQGSAIESLPGGTIQGDTEDIEVAINRYITGLKVPKPYLDYSEEWAKANIANLDIRFSKTIRRVQQAIISEIKKLGIVHLITMGYKGQALYDWDIEMTNPSTIAELQKLDMWEKRLSIVSNAKQTEILPMDYIFAEFLNKSDAEINLIKRQLVKDKMWEKLGESLTEKFASRLEESSPSETAEAGGGEEGAAAGAEEGGGKEGESAGKVKDLVKGESKNYLPPKTRTPDLSAAPSSEEQLKRVSPNKGDSLEDPYDRDWFKRTASNMAENEDAMEEVEEYILKKEGKIVITEGQAPHKHKDRRRGANSLFEGMVDEIEQGLAQRRRELREVAGGAIIIEDEDAEDEEQE